MSELEINLFEAGSQSRDKVGGLGKIVTALAVRLGMAPERANLDAEIPKIEVPLGLADKTVGKVNPNDFRL